MVLAPEHELVYKITTEAQKQEVEEYIDKASKKSERERMTEVKKVSGVYTGGHVIHPFTGDKLQIWVADYVLAGYGTGAVMAVPSGDQRDWNFAKHFDLPIPAVIEGSNVEESANDDKDGILINSSFLDGLKVDKAIETILDKLESEGKGERKMRE